MNTNLQEFVEGNFMAVLYAACLVASLVIVAVEYFFGPAPTLIVFAVTAFLLFRNTDKLQEMRKKQLLKKRRAENENLD